MKITFLTSGSVKSNFTYRNVQLARSLKKQGHDVSIICPIADKYNDFKPEIVKEIYGVKVIQPFQFKTRRVEINLLPYIIHTFFILLKNKSDLVFIYKPTPISIVGLVSKFVYGSKIVLDMDDVGSEVMKIEGHPKHQIKLVEWCEEKAANFSDAIITASTFLQKRYRNHYKNKPIITISNGVSNDWFKELNFTNHNKRIVFMGSINRKNILEPLFDALPEIISSNPDLEVLIIGDGNFLNYFKDKSKELGLDKNVIFKGWMKIEDAEKLLMAGDIGYNYMPNELTTKSASNMKVMQYMARGVVPFVSNIGDLPSYVDFGNAGYIVSVDNKEDFILKLNLALSDDRKIKAQNAQKYAISKFDWDVLGVNFLNWFNEQNEKNFVYENKVKDIYYVSITVPGNVGGGEIRNYFLLKKWSELKDFSTKLIAISTKGVERDVANVESDLNIRTNILFRSKRTIFRTIKSVFIDILPPYMNDFKASGIGRAFYKECKKNMPDIVQLQQVHAYYPIRKYIPWLKKNGVKIILDCHNVEYKLLEDSLSIMSPIKKMSGKFLVKGLEKLEIEAVINADVVLCCSELDRDFFIKYNKNVFVVPNGVDYDYFNNKNTKKENSLIFMGGVGYPPNADAVKYYVNEIHPLVKAKVPDIKVYLVGTDKNWLGDIKDDSIVPLGFVDDVREYLNKSKIGISPIRYGSGTRLKIMTYMASGLASVSTSKGAEGVNYTNNENILLEDNTKEFADGIVKLLNDDELYLKVAKNGNKFVAENFDWNIIGDKLQKIYENI